MSVGLELRGNRLWAHGPYGHIELVAGGPPMEAKGNRKAAGTRLAQGYGTGRCLRCNRAYWWAKPLPLLPVRCPCCGVPVGRTTTRYGGPWYLVVERDAPRLGAPPELTINYVYNELAARGYPILATNVHTAYGEAKVSGTGMARLRKYLGAMQATPRLHDLVPLVYSLYKQLELA